MKPAARVIPNVPSFSVDGGFWYSIPDHLESDIQLGTIVRVPLSGRRTRGWVVEVGESDSPRLKDIAGVSGAMPVFDRSLLNSLEWASRHYVAPLSTLLARTTPPNLPRSRHDACQAVAVDDGHPLGRLAQRTEAGKVTPTTALIGNWRKLDWVDSLSSVTAGGRSALVVAASVAEVKQVAEALERSNGRTVVAVTGEDDAADTRAWEKAQSPPRIVVGTPKTASWHIGELAMAVVLEENRRAMKDRQTPTIHVRDLLIARRRLERFNLVFFGPTPGVELLAAGAEIVRVGNRAWPLVEIVDRRDDDSGFIANRTTAAIKGAVEAGRSVFVFTHRRVASASARCSRCRTLRKCVSCQSRLGRVDRCARCSAAAGPCDACGGIEFEEMGTIPERLVAEINRKLGQRTAGVHPARTPVTVGTERDLASLESVDLAIAADVDGILQGSGYRAEEEALRQLARLATTVGRGKGARLVLQTATPDSDLVVTMRRGDPVSYVEKILVSRARDGFPPSTEMAAVELRGEIPEVDFGDLHGQVTVLGPMEIENGRRWLLMGDLGEARLELRQMVRRWRDGGATVRVDVDPIDV